MTDRLSLALLGTPVLLRADQPLARLRSAKAYALFYYLLLTRRAQPRTVLADLFWGDGGEYYARRNLNRTLSNVGQAVGDHLQITRQSLAFAANDAVWFDVDLLERAATLSPTADTIDQLIAATQLYRGDLLDGFQLQDAPAFEQWLAAERQRLRNIVLDLLGSIAGYYADQGDLTAAIDYNRRILQREPWREESHYHLMRLLAQSGQRGAALAQFELCEQALRIELDVEPAKSTLALVEEIRSGVIGVVPPLQRSSAPSSPTFAPQNRITPPHNLPGQRTPFVGRTAELVDLNRLLLEDNDCRLLTLIGPGGMGKTRLAIQAAAQIYATPIISQRFVDGVFFVPLEHVGDLSGIIGAIMAALGAENTFTRQGQRTVAEQLIHDLRSKAMLLILDNFEHLIPYAHFCSTLLACASNIKLLVTSRESLALQEAWFYPLLGLAMPTGRVAHESRQGDADAVRLFAQCARRANPAFVLETEVAAVAQICTLVEGMPLAIELAAAWCKMMTCAQIAQEVAQGLDFLTARYQNIPARHRSMRAVMDHSWALLTAEESIAIARLAIFRGQFHQAAAYAITGTSLLTLAALVEKALVRVTPAGSYQLHELTRQYAAERLTDDELHALRDAHAHYYADLLEQQRTLLFTHRYRQVWTTVENEFDNILAAWQWVIDTIGADGIAPDTGAIPSVLTPTLSPALLIRQMAEVLTRYYLAQGLLAAGQGLFDYACHQLAAAGWSIYDPGAAAEERRATLLHLQIRAALFQMELGHYGASLALVERLERDCHAVGLPEDQCALLIIYGQTQVRRGVRRAATAHFQTALALGETLAPRYAAEALIGLGVVASGEGRYGDARMHYRRALALCHEMGYRPWVARLLTNLGTTYSRQADYQQAEAHYTEALALAQDEGDQNLVMVNTSNLGGVYSGLAHYPLAIEQYQRSLAMARSLGEARWVAANLNGLAQTYLATAALPMAEAALREALTVGQQSDSAPDTLGSISLFAHLAARYGQPEQALHLLLFVEEHPATMARDRRYNAPLLAELRSDLSPERSTAIATWVAAQTLETVIVELLDAAISVKKFDDTNGSRSTAPPNA